MPPRRLCTRAHVAGREPSAGGHTAVPERAPPLLQFDNITAKAFSSKDSERGQYDKKDKSFLVTVNRSICCPLPPASVACPPVEWHRVDGLVLYSPLPRREGGRRLTRSHKRGRGSRTQFLRVFPQQERSLARVPLDLSGQTAAAGASRCACAPVCARARHRIIQSAPTARTCRYAMTHEDCTCVRAQGWRRMRQRKHWSVR